MENTGWLARRPVTPEALPTMPRLQLETGWVRSARNRTMAVGSMTTEHGHVAERASNPPAPDLQPPGVVESGRAIGGADCAGGVAHRRRAAARRRRRPNRAVADRADAAVHPVRDPGR